MMPGMDFDRGYVRGLFDGEGGVYARSQGSATSFCVAMVNTESDIVDRCVRILDSLGIEYRRTLTRHDRRDNRKPLHWIIIGRARDILRFAELVGFGSPVKAAKLEAAMQYHNRPESRRHSGEEPTRDDLYRLYVQERLTADEIGQQFGYRSKSGGAILRLLHRYGIPVRAAGPRTGDANHRGKLSDADVCEIRAARKQGDSYAAISRRFGISEPYAQKIVAMRRRADVAC